MEEEKIKKTKADDTIRVDTEFNNQIGEIQKQRLKNLKDINKTSSRKVTSMIPKHKFWQKIKEDIIRWDFNAPASIEQ